MKYVIIVYRESQFFKGKVVTKTRVLTVPEVFTSRPISERAFAVNEDAMKYRDSVKDEFVKKFPEFMESDWTYEILEVDSEKLLNL